MFSIFSFRFRLAAQTFCFNFSWNPKYTSNKLLLRSTTICDLSNSIFSHTTFMGDFAVNLNSYISNITTAQWFIYFKSRHTTVVWIADSSANNMFMTLVLGNYCCSCFRHHTWIAWHLTFLHTYSQKQCNCIHRFGKFWS